MPWVNIVPSPIEERKWGWVGVVAPARVPPSKASFSNVFSEIINQK